MMAASPIELDLSGVEGLSVLHDADLTDRNTLGIAARTSLLIAVRDEAALCHLTRQLSRAGRSWTVLGGGSNIVLSREKYDGPFIMLEGQFRRVERIADNTIRAGGGASAAALLRRCEAEGVGGLECLWGIPGTMGGAVAGNAGCGREAIGERVEAARVVAGGGEVRDLRREDLKFGYRQSSLIGAIVISADLRVERMSDSERRARVEATRAARSGQPVGAPSAGCVFRNPPGDRAGRLIDAAGLKGTRIGRAQVSTVHANYIVNNGGARGADVVELIELVRQRVKERFDVWLELEVNVV